jgi:tmRNA-binding protein
MYVEKSRNEKSYLNKLKINKYNNNDNNNNNNNNNRPALLYDTTLKEYKESLLKFIMIINQLKIYFNNNNNLTVTII